jgi:hypothetical protein
MMVSVGSLFYALDTWKRYSNVVEYIEPLKPLDSAQYLKALEEMESTEDTKRLALDSLENSENNLKYRHDFSVDVLTASKDHFLIFLIMSGSSVILSMILIVGLAPMFKKSSNKSLNQDAQ